MNSRKAHPVSAAQRAAMGFGRRRVRVAPSLSAHAGRACPHTTQPGSGIPCSMCSIEAGTLEPSTIRRIPPGADYCRREVARVHGMLTGTAPAADPAPELDDDDEEPSARSTRRPRRAPAHPRNDGYREGVVRSAVEAWLARTPMIADMPDDEEGTS